MAEAGRIWGQKGCYVPEKCKLLQERVKAQKTYPSCEEMIRHAAEDDLLQRELRMALDAVNIVLRVLGSEWPVFQNHFDIIDNHGEHLLRIANV